jgi:general secretion pathway protein F
MPTYRYKAIANSGAIVSGTGEARSEALLVQQLRSQGQFPVSATLVVSHNAAGRLAALLQLRFKPSRRMLTTVTQELAALLGAGLELDRALGTLAGLTDIGPFHAPFAAARQRVRDGATFGDALAQEDLFPPFYINMIRAGEMGGTLDKTLSRLGDYLSRTLAVREAVTSALIYPIILLVTAGLSIIIILTFVLPELQPLFAESGHALPWPTRVIMALSDFVRGYWWLLVASAAGAAIGLRAALRRPEMRQKIDRALLALPLIGETLRAMEVERFCRTLGTLVGNGVALPVALNLSSGVLWNSVLRDAVSGAAASLREGESLSQRLARTSAFPPLTLDLIQIGEETGRLDEMLLRQADLDDQRIRHTIDRLLALLVPVLTIVLGFIVAGLIASMLVAILSVNDLALQ